MTTDHDIDTAMLLRIIADHEARRLRLIDTLRSRMAFAETHPGLSWNVGVYREVLRLIGAEDGPP